MQPHSVQVVITAGPDAPARAVLGLQAALAAAASGIRVDAFLALEATQWACEPRVLTGAESIYDLLDQLTSFGVTVTCCSSCAQDLCGTDVSGAATDGRGAAVATHADVELIGLAALMERVASGVPTVTF